MTLDPASWLHLAQQLALGERRRENHDCGDGRTLIVAHTDTGWNAYCWRCSDKGFRGLPQPSMAERLAKLRAVQQVEEEAQASPDLPTPCNREVSTWPLEARVWLYKAGFSNEYARRCGFYWNSRLERAVLPVAGSNNEGYGGVVYWQARGFNPSRAKYINPVIDKRNIAAIYGRTGPVVITEDILSAARVGEVAQGWSILGTALSDALAARVAAMAVPVFIWLDPDGAGRRARGKILRTLSLLGVDARIVRTDKDPKYYDRQEIASILTSPC